MVLPFVSITSCCSLVISNDSKSTILSLVSLPEVPWIGFRTFLITTQAWKLVDCEDFESFFLMGIVLTIEVGKTI